MTLLLKLILAHLLGDFIIQPRSWVEAKKEKKLKSFQLYLHALVHGILIMVLVWEISFLPWALLVMLIHLIIDGTKLLLQKKESVRSFFFLDQIAYLVSLYLVFSWYSGNTFIDQSLFNEANLLSVTCIIFLTMPSSYLTGTFMSKWNPAIEVYTSDSLQDAGMYIGIFERLLTFTFVINGHWEGVGFLLAAKSIFRFGDLKKSKHRKLTEYILVGSLVSFGIAIAIGLIYNSWLVD